MQNFPLGLSPQITLYVSAVITSALGAALCSARTCRNSEWLQTDPEILWRVVAYKSFLCHFLKAVPYLKVGLNLDFDTLWGLLTSMYDISIQGSEVCQELGRKKHLVLGFSWHYLYCQESSSGLQWF